MKKKKCGGKSQCTRSKYQQQKAKELWLLILKLSKRLKVTAKKIVKIYRLRMQIEESFRDTKNTKLGISLEQAHSTNSQSWL
ncbi:transposase [Pseudoalteromonas sp. NBT06-2]|uniref:transposase n=1 Tax=Pseudoalteromonas sp. NBT06-2 TaxID=2025950 RepID=UPI00336BE791